MALRGRRFQVETMVNTLLLRVTLRGVSAQCSPRHLIRLSTASEGHRTCGFCRAGVLSVAPKAGCSFHGRALRRRLRELAVRAVGVRVAHGGRSAHFVVHSEVRGSHSAERGKPGPAFWGQSGGIRTFDPQLFLTLRARPRRLQRIRPSCYRFL